MRNFQAESQEDSQAQEQIKRIIDSFNFEELRNFLNQEDNQIYKVQRLRDYLFKNISQCFDKVIIELQTNPTYDCSQLLIFIQENTNQGRRNNYNFRNLFNDYENLFKILEYTDDLHIYDLVFQILSNCIQIIHFDRQGFIPRLLYLEKIFYSHSNFLCSKKINLIDYYFMDPRYQEICNDPIESLQFDLEYYEPTQLDETYHELQRNGRHQKILSGIFQIKKIQIIDDNSTSALELSRNLLNMQTQSFSPLMDILKYRILINRGLQANSQQTKNIIIGLHLKSLNILKSQKEQFVALHIFERFYDDVIGDTIENNNFNLFQLETIDPIILVELLQIESRNNQQSSKRKQQFQLKLLSDVLSMRQIENNDFIQGYPLKYNSKILSESLAQDSQLTSGILIFFIKSSQTCNSFYNDITKMLIKILSIQNNKLLLQPEQIKQTLLLLNKCITRDQVQFTLYINDSLPIFDYYIKEGYNLQKPTQDGYVQINETETDAIIVTCIKNLSQFFELIRKHHSFTDDSYNFQQLFLKNQLSSLLKFIKSKIHNF